MIRHLLDESISTYGMEGERLFDLEHLRVLNENSKVNISRKTVLYRIADNQAFKECFFCKASLGICNRIDSLGSH